MNRISVSMTPANTVKYPLHQHDTWEIMYYLNGTGYMATQSGNIPFEKGSIIIVPPQTFHGSVSENGFTNISIGGNFSHLLMFEKPLRVYDSAPEEGATLAKMIWNNRYANENYLSALCTAYACFLLQSAKYESGIGQAVSDIIKQIDEHYSDCNLNITALLKASGYAEDYIRAEFKRITSLTPIQFLTKVRMEHARNLLEIYGKQRSVAEIAQCCGFEDSVYFSKQFKRWIGVAPDHYRTQCGTSYID